jgi:hypothetical protein
MKAAALHLSTIWDAFSQETCIQEQVLKCNMSDSNARSQFSDTRNSKAV